MQILAPLIGRSRASPSGRRVGAGNFPKHRILSDCRALHLQELAALFVQIVKLAGECGLLKLGTIAVDGTQLRANASKHKAMSHERMQRREVELKAQIDALPARAKQADEAQAGEPELDQRLDMPTAAPGSAAFAVDLYLPPLDRWLPRHTVRSFIDKWKDGLQERIRKCAPPVRLNTEKVAVSTSHAVLNCVRSSKLRLTQQFVGLALICVVWRRYPLLVTGITALSNAV